MSIPFIQLKDLQNTFENLIMDNLDESVVDFATLNQHIRERPTHDIRDNKLSLLNFPRNVEYIYELLLSRRQKTNNVLEGFI